ncbi:MAG: thiol reductant ABC exporter subunit CydC [SAR202 cluster bacterium Io17-Chloro-G4]|nr:MAG: thiol reductant ABC exporter subunit CydC [SAR202 cluster bacterium Io17-Chloro-G4]
MYLHPRLLALTEGVRLRILAAALIGLLAVAAGVARLAVAATVIVKVIHEGAAFSTLTWALVIMAALIVVRGALQYLQEVISHHTASIVKVQLRKTLYEHSLALGPGFFDQTRTGDVMLSLADGVERLEAFFGKYLPQLIVAALAPILIFIFMAIIDLRIGFIFLGFALFTLVAPNFFHRWNKSSSMARREAYGVLGADFLDAVQGLGTLKAFGQSRVRGQLLADRSRRLYRTTMGVLAANSVTSAITVLGIAAGASAALAYGAVRVEDGGLELRPLLIVLMLGVEIFRPLRELVNLYHEGVMAMSSAEGIFAIMDEQVDVKDPGSADIEAQAGIAQATMANDNFTATNQTNGGIHSGQLYDIDGQNLLSPEIAFDGVSFAYSGGRRSVLEEVSFTLAAGETMGLVGSSGAGKSTAVWLLLRFYDPQHGRILLGGKDIRELPLEYLRRHIAVVTQDTYLFHGSVADNLRFGNPEATQEQLESAARAANAHDFISGLSHGYETMVGERALRLSGGQKQRIAIARALLKDAPILVLDEALSNVDAENEALIQQALDRLMEGRTTLVIAHRLSSVVNANRILVLENGRLVESGTHDEMVAANGAYALLMAQQQAGPEEDYMVATVAREEDPDHAVQSPSEAMSSLPQTLHGHGDDHGHGHHHAPAAETAEDGHAGGKPIGIMAVWGRLLNLVKPWWGQLALTFVLGLAHHGSIIGVGVIGALLVGQVITGGELTLLIVLLGIFVPMVGLFTWAESWIAHDLAYRLLAEMRVDMYDKLDPLAPAYLVRRRSGDLISIVGGDVELVEFFFAHTITPAFVAILVPAAVLATLAVISWPLALVLAPFLVAVAVSPFIAQKRAERLGEELREQVGEVHAHMVDSIQGLREISAFGRGRARAAEIVRNGWVFAHSQMRFLKEQAFQVGFIEAMTALGGLTVLAMALWFMIQGDISRPELILAVILSVAAFAPVSDLARTMKQLLETLAAARRVFSIHDEPVPVVDGKGVHGPISSNGAVAPSISFHEVGFSYGPHEPQALHNVSFSAEPGETVALVGRSGAGKSTCANLLMRFWDPGHGQIDLGGHDLKDFGLDHLREQIALVTQDTYLFNATIKDNLRLGRQDATDQEVEEAAQQANAHDFIMSFPDGYETMAGERGMQLSGGQRQRISIARALLKNSPVLVLDEATSHLDAVNEQQVRHALERLMEGRTTLVIAHRLSTIREADRIVVLDDGHVVEQGDHHHLLAQSGLYSQLVSTQLVGATSRSSEHNGHGDSHEDEHGQDHGHHGAGSKPWHGLSGHDEHHH